MDGQEKIEVSRRALLGAAAFAGVFGVVMASAAAQAEDAGVTTGPAPDLSTLPRTRVNLVAPPFVHDHEPVAVAREATAAQRPLTNSSQPARN